MVVAKELDEKVGVVDEKIDVVDGKSAVGAKGVDDEMCTVDGTSVVVALGVDDKRGIVDAKSVADAKSVVDAMGAVLVDDDAMSAEFATNFLRIDVDVDHDVVGVGDAMSGRVRGV